MSTWAVLLLVALAGLTASLIRSLTARMMARPVRRRRHRQPMRTARAIGIPEGEGLVVWVDRGKSLPASCRRMVRVSASQGDMVPLQFHSDGPEMEPLLHIEVGPIDRTEMKVRLVEVELKIADDGRMKANAKVRSTSTPIPIRVIGRPPPRVPTEVDDTRLV